MDRLEQRMRLAALKGRNFGFVACAANDLRRTMEKQMHRGCDANDNMSPWRYLTWAIGVLFLGAVWWLWGFVA